MESPGDGREGGREMKEREGERGREGGRDGERERGERGGDRETEREYFNGVLQIS